jgi:raffinose/stachyose/melibiose transport system substrate-binding protein
MASYAEAGKFLDLSSFVADNPEITDKFLPSALKNGQVGDKTYALPNAAIQPVFLWSNLDVFDQIGENPPTTWDELMSDVGKFRDKGIQPISVAGQSQWPELQWLEYLIDRIGGPEVFQRIAANEPDAWSDPAVTQALEMIQQLRDAGGFADGFASISTDNEADVAQVYTGKAAMVLQGSWKYPVFKEGAPDAVASGRIAYSLFPSVEGGKGDNSDTVGSPSNFLAVNADIDDESLAVVQAYLKDALFNDDFTQDVLKRGGVPPLTGLDATFTGDDSDFLSYTYQVGVNAKNFDLSWDQALQPGQASELLTNLSQVFAGTQAPDQFVSAMNETIAR